MRDHWRYPLKERISPGSAPSSLVGNISLEPGAVAVVESAVDRVVGATVIMYVTKLF